MSVGRICTRDVHVADPCDKVCRAAELMHERGVGTLVVVDGGQNPLGIVTDRDLVERVMAKRLDPNVTTVADVMTHAPNTICEQTPIEQAIAEMRRERCRRLPVVDDRGRLVGLLSLDDIVHLLAEELTFVGELLERQSSHSPAHV